MSNLDPVPLCLDAYLEEQAREPSPFETFSRGAPKGERAALTQGPSTIAPLTQEPSIIAPLTQGPLTMTPTYGFYAPGTDSMLPIIKINCQDGRIWRVDRSQNSSGAWESTDVDITRTIKFVPDFTKLEIGFIRYADPGVDFQLQTFDAWVEAGRPRKPPEGYKFGFRLPVLLAKECQREENDVRHLSHTSAGVLKAVSKIFADWQQLRDNGIPRLPVLALMRFEKKQQGQFRNFEPEFAAGAWINRPEIFDEKLAPLSEEPDAQDAPEDKDDLPF